MKLIQCHAWTPGYHTPSCPTNPFNLFLSFSLLRTCLGAAFHFSLQHRERDSRLIQFIQLLKAESLCASTVLSPLFYLILLLSSTTLAVDTHTHKKKPLHKKRKASALRYLLFISVHKGLRSLAGTCENRPKLMNNEIQCSWTLLAILHCQIDVLLPQSEVYASLKAAEVCTQTSCK